MFRCYIHHHQRELKRPLLKTTSCYVATVYDHWNSCAVNYKRYNFVLTEVTMYIEWFKSAMFHLAINVKTLKIYD
jgi:hypothetical protein